MGSNFEFNDTLILTKEQGFPIDVLNLGNPMKLEDVKDKIFEFRKSGTRIFHTSPTRCFLVQKINGKWLYWGHAVIIEQTIKDLETIGKFKIVKIYDSEYQKETTKNESPEGMSYFE